MLLRLVGFLADAEPVANLRTPHLPAFLGPKARPLFDIRHTAAPYLQLLNRLRGELGFREQETALRWLLEQLDSSDDLRRLILVLLKEGKC